MKKRKLVLLSLVGLFGLVSLTACGKKESGGDNNKTEITYYNFSATPDNEEVLADMVDAFETQNDDVKVNVQSVSFDDYFTKLQTLIAGGKTPDVFELNYENFVSYANKGTLLDLSSYIKADTSFDEKALNQSAFEAYQYEGKQYGMVESFSNVVLYYNKSLFDQAKIDYPTADWTWEDEVKAGKAISALGDDIYGSFSHVTMNEFFKVVEQNNGSLFDENGKPTLNTKENIEALEYMTNRILVDKINPSPAEMAGQLDADLFMNNQLGMTHTGIWMFATFKDADFDWDIVVEPGNKTKATHFFANGIVVNKDLEKDEKKAQAAYEFASFMSASNEAGELRIQNSWELPAITNEEVLEPYLNMDNPTNRQAVFDSLDYLVLPPAVNDWSKLSDLTDAEFEKVLLGEQTATECLDKLQVEFEKIVK